MRVIAALLLVGLALGGCVYRAPRSVAQEERLVAPAASPVDAAAASPVTAVPGAAAVPPSQRVVMYDHGRFELYGDGTAVSPYYWVWVPAGTTPPAPPPSPTR